MPSWDIRYQSTLPKAMSTAMDGRAEGKPLSNVPGLLIELKPRDVEYSVDGTQ